MRYTAAERSAIPREIRALVRVISDLDHTQFPELVADGPNLSVRELEALLTEITGEPLSSREFRLFQATYMEVRECLRGVDPATAAGSQVGGILTLTSRLDAICREAGVPLALVFPNVKEAHNFFLDIISFRASVSQAPFFFCLSDTICALLARALTDLQRYMNTDGEEGLSRNIVTSGTAAMTDEFPTTITSEGIGGGCHHDGKDSPPYSDVENGDGGKSMGWMREGVNLPHEFACIFADIDGDTGMHLAHLRWFVEACRRSKRFDTVAYIGDVAARKAWNAYAGEHALACFAENFAPALEIFPEWSRTPIMDALNYRGCGVVSLYTLKRLLDVWGPFLLLDRNMQSDMRIGLFDLGHSLAYLSKALAGRPDAANGDCVVTLTEVPGEVAALLLLERRSADAADGDDGHNGLITWTIRLTQKTGAWVAEGLTAEEYDSVHDACSAFPDLFRCPCGPFHNVGDKSDRTLVERNFDTVSHTASSLHHACFRNNARYVKTLLGRGSALVVNTALVDPAISSQFCWTPLLCAVNNPCSDPGDIVQMLLGVDADVHICDDAGCTALYYAIANGYVNATRLLLEKCPSLLTSNSSKPLLVALGAHHFHARESDIRRLSDLIPSAEMLEVLLPYQTSLKLVSLAADILMDKFRGEERMQQPKDDPSIWHSTDGEVEHRTPEAAENLSNIIAYHNRLCQGFKGDISRAARLLYSHCYFLSCREQFGQNKGDSEEGA